MFKLIAIRILPGCDASIRKCLHTGCFYYFSNDYTIVNDGKTICRSSKHLNPLSESFFSIEVGKKDGIVFNLQAVVGMNGDGKSSLVEIALRLLNNFAISHKIFSDNKLIAAEKVSAELYYQNEGTFYCIKEVDGSVEDIRLWQYNLNHKTGLYYQDSTIAKENLKDSFFYTIVSNYSHYAYNTLDYAGESATNQENKCWLHNVFHKNDGYQAPISLHPYRDKGIIDINREKELTKPRLVSTFLKSMMSAEKRNETFEVNGKEVAGLKLTDIGYSKFQEVTLNAFFRKNRHTSLLQKEIEELRNLDSIDNTDTGVMLLSGYTRDLQDAYKKYFGHKRNRDLYSLMKVWIRANDLLDGDSDISNFINTLQNIASTFLDEVDANELIDICRKWEEYADFNLCQIQRIELIDDICDQWRRPGVIIGSEKAITIDVAPDVLLKSYADLNDREKCLHYIIYKTISIFETYDSYGKPFADYASRPFFFDGNPAPRMPYDKCEGKMISRPFAKLSQDWLFGSHITLKLRQTYNYFKPDGNSTYTLYPPKVKNDELSDDTLFFSNMSKENRHRLMIDEQLPPAIYYWDLVFWVDGELLTLDSFSSGEKQKLFSISAIIYHLQNISSVASETYHYHSANIILEETELYFHPEWQRSFSLELMRMISDAAVQNIHNINILFVTHSPYILSDIPKNNVLFLKDGQPYYKMQENTFGANINSLLKNGFFMPSLPMGAFAHEKINQLFGKLHTGDFDMSGIDALRSEIQIVGEPYIRQQLYTLLNMYSQIDTNQIKELLRQIIAEQESND